MNSFKHKTCNLWGLNPRGITSITALTLRLNHSAKVARALCYILPTPHFKNALMSATRIRGHPRPGRAGLIRPENVSPSPALRWRPRAISSSRVSCCCSVRMSRSSVLRSSMSSRTCTSLARTIARRVEYGSCSVLLRLFWASAVWFGYSCISAFCGSSLSCSTVRSSCA